MTNWKDSLTARKDERIISHSLIGKTIGVHYICRFKSYCESLGFATAAYTDNKALVLNKKTEHGKR